MNIIMQKYVMCTLILSFVISVAPKSAGDAIQEVFNIQYSPQQIDVKYEDLDFYIPYRSDSIDHFSWLLLKEVFQEEPTNQNIVISPFSVKLVLALLSEAAGNKTRTYTQLISTLTDIKSTDNLREYYKKVLASLNKRNPYYTFNLETKLYVDEYIEPQQKYAATVGSFYSTPIENIRFADSELAAERINTWCNTVTQGRLRQLVNQDNIKNNVMLLVNVIFFKGEWRRQFTNSFQGIFFLRPPTEAVTVEYMDQKDSFFYHNSMELNAKILRLPYKGNKFSMFILLPHSNSSLQEMIYRLENDVLKSMQFAMQEVEVKVTIPKFKFDFNSDVKKTLTHLGITEIFSNNASLPGLARGGDIAGKLKVSNIFQKAGIEVNEKGTVAFAATVVEIENKFGGSTIIEEFHANRPFLFFIEEESTGNIMFAGKVIEPFI